MQNNCLFLPASIQHTTALNLKKEKNVKRVIGLKICHSITRKENFDFDEIKLWVIQMPPHRSFSQCFLQNYKGVVLLEIQELLETLKNNIYIQGLPCITSKVYKMWKKVHNVL